MSINCICLLNYLLKSVYVCVNSADEATDSADSAQTNSITRRNLVAENKAAA